MNDAQIDVFSDKFIEARKDELKKRVNKKRYEHILSVAKTAKKLAKMYGVDPDKAYLAGLLHDWDKDYTNDEIRERINELGLDETLDAFAIENMPQTLHGPTAARALSIEFPQIPDDVIRAIAHHTTASVDPDDLEKIVYIADVVEPTRTFKDAPVIRNLIGEVSLDELFFEVYRFWTIAILRQGKVLHPDTINIWNALAEKTKHPKL